MKNKIKYKIKYNQTKAQQKNIQSMDKTNQKLFIYFIKNIFEKQHFILKNTNISKKFFV